MLLVAVSSILLFPNFPYFSNYNTTPFNTTRLQQLLTRCWKKFGSRYLSKRSAKLMPDFCHFAWHRNRKLKHWQTHIAAIESNVSWHCRIINTTVTCLVSKAARKWNWITFHLLRKMSTAYVSIRQQINNLKKRNVQKFWFHMSKL